MERKKRGHAIRSLKAGKAAKRLASTAGKKPGSTASSRLRGRLRSGSFLLTRTSRLSARIAWSFEHGVLSGALCASEKIEEAWRNSLLMRFFRWLTGSEPASAFRKIVASEAEESLVFRAAARLKRVFLHTRCRFFGVAGLIGALYAVGGFLLHRYVGLEYGIGQVTGLFVPAALLLFSVPMLFSRLPVCRMCTENRLLSWLLIGMLGMDPASLREDPEEPVGTHGGAAFFVGTLLGLAMVFFRPVAVLAAVGAALFAAVLLCTPEAGLLSAAVLLPIAPREAMSVIVFATAVSWLGKYLRLKRAFRLGAGEAFLVLCLFAFGLAARTGGDSGAFPELLTYAGIWILAVNLLKTPSLYRKFLSALLYGGILFAFRSLLCRVLLDGALLGGIFLPLAAELPFALPDTGMTLAGTECFLLMLLPLTLLRGKSLSGFVSLVLIGANAFLIGDLRLYLGLLFGALAYIAVAHRAAAGAALTGAVTVPALLSVFGGSLGALPIAFSRAGKELAERHWLTGVGTGERMLRLASHADGIVFDGAVCGLYRGLLVTGGIPCLVAFLLPAVFALQCLFCCLRREPEPDIRQMCGGLLVCWAVFLIAGAFADVFSELRLLGLFWSVCAAMTVPRALFVPYGEKAESAR